jgi:hypothetical protein
MSPLRTPGKERAIENESRGHQQMPNQRTLPHHHQEKDLKRVSKPQAARTPEGELIALADAKGQRLAAHTLRTIKESLELQGVELDEFIDWARAHLQRGIFNPSGFIIIRAHNFRTLSSPATPPARPASRSSPPLGGADCCEACGGEGLVLQSDGIVPCPKCSTPESRREWELKEAERGRLANAVRNNNELKTVPADGATRPVLKRTAGATGLSTL